MEHYGASRSIHATFFKKAEHLSLGAKLQSLLASSETLLLWESQRRKRITAVPDHSIFYTDSGFGNAGCHVACFHSKDSITYLLPSHLTLTSSIRTDLCLICSSSVDQLGASSSWSPQGLLKYTNTFAMTTSLDSWAHITPVQNLLEIHKQHLKCSSHPGSLSTVSMCIFL